MINPTIYNISATAGTFEVRCSNPTASNLSAVADLIFSKMEKEIWKAVPTYELSYQVSNLGRVKSFKYRDERILKPFTHFGYEHVTLMMAGHRKHFRVNILVAMAFLGHTSRSDGNVVDHINGIRNDNRLENLRVVTHRFNNSYGYRKNQDSFTSQYVGVSLSRTGKWRAQIGINGVKKTLGSFNSEAEAHNEYLKQLNIIQNQK